MNYTLIMTKKISFSRVKVQLGTLWGLVYVAHNEQAGFV